MSRKEFNSKCKALDLTLDRTALVTPGNGHGVILIPSFSTEQVILPSKSVSTLARSHLIFLSSRNVFMKEGKKENNEDIPQQGAVVSWLSVQ